MSRHCLVFSADIDQRALNVLITYATELKTYGAQELLIALNSAGGSVVAGIAMYNFLQATGIDITTHNFGNTDSIANVVFLAGKQRYASPSSTFMFHGVGFNISTA